MGADDTLQGTYVANLLGITTLTYVYTIEAGEKWHLDISFLVPDYMRKAGAQFFEFALYGISTCDACDPYLTFSLDRLRFEVEGGGSTL